ncbi:MAG: GspE/PulE/PilB domain-containing protein [Pirellulales bacterium]
MSNPLDVYRDWLGIAETARPLNYYQLLRLKMFEDDPAKVRAHYRKMNAHVRKFAAGDYARQSQELLNELAKAMLCLTDANRKGEYDATLGRTQPRAGRRQTLEEILLGRKAVDPSQLEKARNFAQATGWDMRDAILQQKLAAPDVVMQAYAESLGLPYVDLEEVGVGEDLVARVPALLARQHSSVPVMVDDGQLLMASPNPLAPEVEDNLRLRFGMPVRTVLCTPVGINAAIAKYYPKEAAQAEMSNPAPARQATAAAPQEAAAKPAAPEPAAAAPTGEPGANRPLIAFIAFNVAVMVVMLSYQLGFLLPKWSFFVPLVIAMILGSIAAGVAFVVAGKRT